MSNLLKFGIPKGSLESATVELFRKAGWNITLSSRSYFPSIDDDEMKCNLIRTQEMSKYVEKGTIDVGIAGRDWVMENDSEVVTVCDLVYSKVSRRPAQWVLVVTQDSPSGVRPIWPGRRSRRNWWALPNAISQSGTYRSRWNSPGAPPRPRWSRGCATPSWR